MKLLRLALVQPLLLANISEIGRTPLIIIIIIIGDDEIGFVSGGWCTYTADGISSRGTRLNAEETSRNRRRGRRTRVVV